MIMYYNYLKGVIATQAGPSLLGAASWASTCA